MSICKICGEFYASAKPINVTMCNNVVNTKLNVCNECAENIFDKIKDFIGVVEESQVFNIDESEPIDNVIEVKKPDVRCKKKQINEEDYNNIIALVKQGLNDTEISRKLKIIVSVVRDCCKYNSYELYCKKESMKDEIDCGKVIALFNAGWYISDIANELNKTRAEVVKVLNNFNQEDSK